jgi:hypothetical protein
MAATYHGIYAGLVTANGDGEGVLQVRVPAVYPSGEELPARPALPYGVLFLPEVGTKVWVQYEGGEPTLPLWTGVHQVGDAWPSDTAPPTARVLRTPTDQRVVLDDTDGSEGVTLLYGGKAHAVRLTSAGVVVEHDSGHALTLGEDSIELAHSSGASLVLESSSATVKLGSSSVMLDSSGVTVNGTMVTVTGSPLVKLGSGAMPVIRMGDSGIGNMGAPVVMTVTTNTSVLA